VLSSLGVGTCRTGGDDGTGKLNRAFEVLLDGDPGGGDDACRGDMFRDAVGACFTVVIELSESRLMV